MQSPAGHGLAPEQAETPQTFVDKVKVFQRRAVERRREEVKMQQQIDRVLSSDDEEQLFSSPRACPSPQGGCIGRLVVAAVDDATKQPTDPARAAAVADSLNSALRLATGVEKVKSAPTSPKAGGELTAPTLDVAQATVASIGTAAASSWDQFVAFVKGAYEAAATWCGEMLEATKAKFDEAVNAWKSSTLDWSKIAAVATVGIILLFGIILAYDQWFKPLIGQRPKYAKPYLDFVTASPDTVTPQSAIAALGAAVTKAGGAVLILAGLTAGMSAIMGGANALAPVREALTVISAVRAMSPSGASETKEGEVPQLKVKKVDKHYHVSHAGALDFHVVDSEGCCEPYVAQIADKIKASRASEGGTYSKFISFLTDNWMVLAGGFAAAVGILSYWRYEKRTEQIERVRRMPRGKPHPQAGKHRASKFRIFKDSPGQSTDCDYDTMRKIMKESYGRVRRVEVIDESGNVTVYDEDNPGHDIGDFWMEFGMEDDYKVDVYDAAELKEERAMAELEEQEHERRTGGDRERPSAFPHCPLPPPTKKKPQAADPSKACDDEKCPFQELPSSKERSAMLKKLTQANPGKAAEMKLHLRNVFHWNAGTTGAKKAALIKAWKNGDTITSAKKKPQATTPSLIPEVSFHTVDGRRICSASCIYGKLLFPFHCVGSDEASKIKSVHVKVGSETQILPIEKFKMWHKPGNDIGYLTYHDKPIWRNMAVGAVPQPNSSTHLWLYNAGVGAHSFYSGRVHNIKEGVVVVKTDGTDVPTAGSCGGYYLPIDGGKTYAVHFASSGAHQFGMMVPTSEVLNRDWNEWAWKPQYGGPEGAHWKGVVAKLDTDFPRGS